MTRADRLIAHAITSRHPVVLSERAAARVVQRMGGTCSEMWQRPVRSDALGIVLHRLFGPDGEWDGYWSLRRLADSDVRERVEY